MTFHRLSIRRILFVGFLFLLLGGSILAAAVPGPQRALAPGFYGLEELGENIWTDAPDRGNELRQLVRDSRAIVRQWLPDADFNARLILCTTAQCQDIFDLKPRGLTYGASLVLIAPQGVNETIISHELTHVALHKHMGLGDLWSQRIPAWFDEGLATLISGETQIARDITETELVRIRQATSFGDWGAAIDDLGGWQRTYGAAAEAVRRQLGAEAPFDVMPFIKSTYLDR